MNRCTTAKRQKRCYCPGDGSLAAIAALLFTVGKHLISLYIGSSNMASTYGAAGALIIVLVWVYYSAQILSCSAPSSQRLTAISGGHALNCGEPYGLSVNPPVPWPIC
jgi:hypothetical protein